jgi:hypothetical protein
MTLTLSARASGDRYDTAHSRRGAQGPDFDRRGDCNGARGISRQGDAPPYSAPRLRIQHQDRRLSVHPGGCHRLQVAGCFVHAERHTFHGGAQQYETAGRRVYVAYDGETAALMTIIVGSLPLFEESEAGSFVSETPITAADGTDLLARADCRVLGLYGTRRQARRHLVAMCAIQPKLEEVQVYSRSAENRARFLAQMQPRVRARLDAVDIPSAPRAARISSALPLAAMCRFSSAPGLRPGST